MMATAINCSEEVGTTWTTIGEVLLGESVVGQVQVGDETVIDELAPATPAHGAHVIGASFEVANAANGQTTSGFRVRIKTDYHGDYVPFLGGTDFDSLANPNVAFCSTIGPHELASGSNAAVIIRLGMIVYAVDFQATVASGSTWISVVGDLF